MFMAVIYLENIIFVLMKRANFRHILFVMLTTVICLGFSSYVLYATYQPVAEISMNEEEQAAGEKSLTELNSFYINENHPIIVPLTVSYDQSFPDLQNELPSFVLSPNTPPPDLA